MSVAVARRKRTALYLSICGLVLVTAALIAISVDDPSGLAPRVLEAVAVIAIAMLFPARIAIPAAFLVWLGAGYGRATLDDAEWLRTTTLLELPALLGVSVFTVLTRRSLDQLEQEDILLGTTNDEFVGIDRETGVYEQRLLLPAIEAELARSRRFGREFALVLATIDERRERFDYRDDDLWAQSLVATAALFRGTRNHIDRVYRYGAGGFALLLPESGVREVQGLVRRLRRVARSSQPAEGQPGGPLPVHFGATFFPACATSTEDMVRRAEVTLKLAEKNATRLQLDGAEAPEMPPPTRLRHADELAVADVADTDDVELQPAVGFDAPRVVAPAVSAEARPHLALVENGSTNGASTHLPDGAAPKPGESLVVALSRVDPHGAAPSAAAGAPASEPVVVASNGLAGNGSSDAAGSPAPAQSVSEAQEPLDDMALLLKRMDETLGMLRELRTNSQP